MVETHRDEVFVRRLESFSDIIIGFSLAQLGLSLAIPGHPHLLLDDPTWIVAYVFTFSLVCMMWWSHYRLFRTVFVPDRVNVILNYAWLATVGLLIYLMQVFVHASGSGSLEDAAFGARLYFGMLAINFGIHAVLLWRGLRMRGSELDMAHLRRITTVIYGMGLSSALLIATIALGVRLGVNAIPIESASIFAGFTAGVLLSKVTHPLSC